MILSTGGRVPGPDGVPDPGVLLRGVCSGECLVENPPGQLLLRVVRILLECILVILMFKLQTFRVFS